MLLDRDDRGLEEHHALTPHDDDRVGRTQIDRDIAARNASKKTRQSHLGT
jgi:hypothetical protein